MTRAFDIALCPTAISPRLQRADGGLDFSVVWKSGATRLNTLRQNAPCRVFFPRGADAGMEAIMVNTGGGLVEGDRISTAIRVGEGARLNVTTQAAEKVYRSLTEEILVATELLVAEDALLIWRPQETILFDGARLRRRQVVSVEKNARFLAAEVVIFGRIARGEHFAHGHLKDSWAVRCGGKLLWMDSLRIQDDVAMQRTRRFGFGDSAGLGTIIYVGRDAASILPVAQETAARLGGGATLVNGILAARFLNRDEAQLRAASETFTNGLRRAIAGSAGWGNA